MPEGVFVVPVSFPAGVVQLPRTLVAAIVCNFNPAVQLSSVFMYSLCLGVLVWKLKLSWEFEVRFASVLCFSEHA